MLLGFQTFGLIVAAWAVGAADAVITDNFERYPLGSFSSAWTDARTLVPGATSPNPSGNIVSTSGPSGLTRAFQTTRSVGTSQGIVNTIQPSVHLAISADVRYDQFDNSTNRNGGGWPMAIGFFQWREGIDPNFAPQVTLFADSTYRNWALYIQTSENPLDYQFIRLTSTITATSTWYSMSLQVDTAKGIIKSQVRLANSADFIVNDIRTISGWKEPSAQYNIAGLLDGEYGTNATLGGQATLDNVLIVPSPGASSLGVLSVIATVRRRDRGRGQVFHA